MADGALVTESPSRRSVLRLCTGALGGGLAGCLAPSDPADLPESERQTSRSTETSAEEPVESATPQRVEAGLSVLNTTDTDVNLTVRVRRDGEQIASRTDEARSHVGGSLGIDVSRPGDYTVEASIESGATATYDWQVRPEYEGQLEIRITGPERVTFREELSAPGCPNGGVNSDLPYSIQGAEDTFQHGTAEIRNEAGQDVTVTVSIAHQGTTFFECTYDLGSRQSVSNDAVTASAGTYTVTADVAGGGRTEYTWNVPAWYHWPKLVVIVPDDGEPLVGCGGPGEVAIGVENPTDEPQTTELALLRGDDPVDEASITVDAESKSKRTLSTPIGDLYTLTAATDSGTDRVTVANCYCYDHRYTTVALDSEPPQIDTTKTVCE